VTAFSFSHIRIRVSSHTLLPPMVAWLTVAAPTRWCCCYGGRECRTLVAAGVARGAEMARCHGALVELSLPWVATALRHGDGSNCRCVKVIAGCFISHGG